MKKIISLVLALVMALGLTTAAFADAGQTTLDQVGGKSLDVKASYTPASKETKYNVNIEWTSMSFTYTEKGTRTWDADSHTYSDVTGEWNQTSSTVTVTNHSSAPVNVTMTFDKQLGSTGLEPTFEGGNALLAAGPENKPEEAQSVTGTLKIGEKNPSSSLANTTMTIGTITVTIAAVA